MGKHVIKDVCPNITFRLKNGKYRVYLYNPERDRYRKIDVSSQKGIIEAKVVSYFPVLPVKYNNNGKSFIHNYNDDDTNVVYDDFRTKIMPNGVTVVDITLAK